jgi:ankyrin repeat protein
MSEQLNPNPNAAIANVLEFREECKNKCRSSLILQYIDICPESLKVADELGYLPLHWLLWNDLSTIEDALMMIEEYPAALQQKNGEGQLPLHIECNNQCRSSIISKCVELYPDALTIAANEGYLPLHWLLWNKSSTIQDALMMVEKYPAALQHQNDYDYLPLHIECNNRCRSAIILKCVELYPESLSKSDRNAFLPLHMLLMNELSSTGDAQAMMEKYPEALQHQNVDGELPLHIECRHRSRWLVILKCVELYPESLAIAEHELGHLPLHCFLWNDRPFVDAAFMMMDKYPAAVQHRSRHGYLPIHIECLKQCRSSIVSKCVELFPVSLAVADRQKCFPLHRLLSNKSSFIGNALIFINKYPAALKHRLNNGDFPIHIECYNQCRLAVVRKCIHDYPESLELPDGGGNTPLNISLNKVLVVSIKSSTGGSNPPDQYKVLPVLSFLTNANPSSYAKLFLDLVADTKNLFSNRSDLTRRMLQNLMPVEMLSPAICKDHHELNWKPRSSLMLFLLGIRKSLTTDESLATRISACRNDRSLKKSAGVASNFMDDAAILIYLMIKTSSLANNALEHEVTLCQSDELGDYMLRHVISYL